MGETEPRNLVARNSRLQFRKPEAKIFVETRRTESLAQGVAMQDLSPDLFFEAVNSYHKTAAMMAAIDLGLFTAIAEGANTSVALAAKVGAAARGARILADSLTIQGFLTKAEGVYALTPSSATFLDQRSP